MQVHGQIKYKHSLEVKTLTVFKTIEKGDPLPVSNWTTWKEGKKPKKSNKVLYRNEAFHYTQYCKKKKKKLILALT